MSKDKKNECQWIKRGMKIIIDKKKRPNLAVALQIEHAKCHTSFSAIFLLCSFMKYNHNTPLCSSQTWKEYDTFHQQGLTFQHFTGVWFSQSRKPLCLCAKRFFDRWIIWIFLFCCKFYDQKPLQHRDTWVFGTEDPAWLGPLVGITLDVTITKGRCMIGRCTN